MKAFCSGCGWNREIVKEFMKGASEVFLCKECLALRERQTQTLDKIDVMPVPLTPLTRENKILLRAGAVIGFAFGLAAGSALMILFG